MKVSYLKSKLGDENLNYIKEKRNIAVNSKVGYSKFIHDMLYICSLTSNLLSVGQLIQKNYFLNFNGDENTIIDEKKVVEKIKMTQNNVFPIIMSLD